MAYSSTRILYTIVISIAIILLVIPSSSGNEVIKKKKDLKRLCKKIKIPKDCWHVVKPKFEKFKGKNYKEVAEIAIDLAAKKSDEIEGKLSEEDKKAYKKCRKDSGIVKDSLKNAKNKVGTDDQSKISKKIDSSLEKIKKSCKEAINDEPVSGLKKISKEFKVYAELAKAVVKILDDSDSD